MNDRELLERAAKAAGIGGAWDWPRGAKEPTCWRGANGVAWRPLTDDGDALRLAMTLGMRVSLRQAEADGGAIREFGTDEDGFAATRRAIVRAAAALAD